MATSAFKSTTKRSPIASQSPADPSDSGSSNRSGLHRRSRSLSRFSGRFPPPDADDYDLPKGKFVNTVRGSGFPEISLDDLAKEFFLAGEDAEKGSEIARGRSGRRVSSVGPGGSSTKVGSTDASHRRGRSVSRSHGSANSDNNSGSKVVSDGGSRRRRSVSVARYKCSDSEVICLSMLFLDLLFWVIISVLLLCFGYCLDDFLLTPLLLKMIWNSQLHCICAEQFFH